MTRPLAAARRLTGLRHWGAGVAAGLLAVLAMICAPPAAGQAAGAPESLTLEAAVELALEHSPQFLRQLNQVTATRHAERQSLGQLLPSLSAGMSFSGNTFRSKTAEDEWGRPISETEFVQSTSSNTSQGLSGSTTLFDLRSIRGYGAARARTAEQAAAVELQAALLRTQVGVDYYDAVLRAELVAVEERGLATARENLAAIRQLLRIAARQPTDVLGAELQVAQAEQSLQRARGAARKAALQLKARMGVAMDRSFDLTSAFPAPFDPARLDLEPLLARAAAGSPRVAQQRAAAEAAERSLGAARAARFPTLTGGYSWMRSANLPEYGAFREWKPENQNWGFRLELGMPLFNRFQTANQVGQAEVEATNASQWLRESRLELEREVRAALIDLENAYTGVQLAERSAEIAREQLRQGQEQYRLNTLDYTALQRMVDQVAAAERDVLQAYHSFAVALLTLEEKVGGPVAADG
jgi:outer membrane protein